MYASSNQFLHSNDADIPHINVTCTSSFLMPIFLVFVRYVNHSKGLYSSGGDRDHRSVKFK